MANDPKKLRKRIFVDHEVQGALLKRVVGHWLFGLAIVGGIVIVISLLGSRHLDRDIAWGRALWHVGPALLAAIVLLPLLVFDCLYVSHRFAGPLVRLRNCWRRLANGERVEKIRFRKDDFWSDLAEEFNRTAERIDRLEARLRGAQPPADDAALPADELEHEESVAAS